MQPYEILESSFAKWIGVKHAISVNTGTAALHVTLAALGIGPGDKVLVPDFTYISTAWAVTYCGATPVFYLPDKFMKVGDDIKAIVVAHIYGVPERMALMNPGIPVIEDACEAHGAMIDGKMVGSLGTAGCFSFQASKIINSQEGGIITTNDDELAAKIRTMKSTANDGKYNHKYLAFNYRMPNAIAELALKSFSDVEKNLKRREEIWFIYDSYLRGVGKPWVEGQVAWVYPISEEVPWGREFFKSAQAQPPYNGPNVAPCGTVLPIDPGMSDEEVHALAQKVEKFIGRKYNYD